ncbi:MAG: dicarboxylate/amino acid:cation symporter [Candidatus Kapaibacteriales bacterium]
MPLFKKKIPLHLKILIALILGAIFGGVFPKNQNELTLDSGNSSTTIDISTDEYFLISSDPSDTIPLTQKLPFQDGVYKVKGYLLLYQSEDGKLIKSTLLDDSNATNEVTVRQHIPPAQYIKPLGDLFINLLSFLAIPLVISSLIVGASSLESISKLGKIGGKAFALYLITTAIAISIGLGLANLFEPGVGLDTSKLMIDYSAGTVADKTLNLSVVDFLVGIVPKNPFAAISSGQMLQIVFLAIIFGVTLSMIEKEKAKSVISFFDGVSTTMIKMVDIIMILAPYGVFALIASIVADFGFGIIDTLLGYMGVVVLGLLIQIIFVYGSITKFIGRFELKRFLLGMANAQAVAFSTSSSAATLPVTIDTLEKKLGIRKEITNFVLPLGATINMDGTALYQGVAAVFIAQVYGIPLDFTQQLSIVLTAVLASIGTAPVPGVGIIMLVLILNSLNIPAEGIALIVGVDRVLDMCRTVANVTGDAAVAVAVSK